MHHISIELQMWKICVMLVPTHPSKWLNSWQNTVSQCCPNHCTAPVCHCQTFYIPSIKFQHKKSFDNLLNFQKNVTHILSSILLRLSDKHKGMAEPLALLYYCKRSLFWRLLSIIIFKYMNVMKSVSLLSGQIQ